MQEVDSRECETKIVRHDINKRAGKANKSISGSNKLPEEWRRQLFIRLEREYVQIIANIIRWARKRSYNIKHKDSRPEENKALKG